MTRNVTAISGVGDGDSSGMSSKNALIGWSIVIGTAVLVFAGTLLLKPEKGR